MAEGGATQPKHALAKLRSGLFVLTARFEGKRAGVLVRSVQPAADEPPLLSVAVRRGHWIEPIIRDSHAFAICKVTSGDSLMLRKFAEASRPRDGDPFDCVQTTRLATGSPILSRATLALDCEVVRHFDLEADHELYIGLVVACHIGPQAELGAAELKPDRAVADPPT